MINEFFSSNLGMQIVIILVGIVMLTMGRNLFWLAVAVIGFVLGLGLGILFTNGQTDWVVLIVAIIGGILGAILAIGLQKIAAAIAGFLLGGYLAIWLMQLMGFELTPWAWILFVIGGIIGIILVLYLFEVALIGVSALIGASLIVQALNLSPTIAGLLFVILLIVGIVIQAKALSEKS
jgi:hypothetical protein